MTTMTGTVLLIGNGYLLLQNDRDGQEVAVNTDCACRFCPGDRVCVCHSGAMTMSIPPQISADCVKCFSCVNCC